MEASEQAAQPGRLSWSQLVTVGRWNPQIAGASIFTAHGSGFCIDRRGIVVTAWHTLRDFYQRRSLIDMHSLEKHGGPSGDVAVELHEVPAVTFFRPEERSLHTMPISIATTNRYDDIAVCAAGGKAEDRPFPFVETSTRVPREGDVVSFLGISTHGPLDPLGEPQGHNQRHGTGKVVKVTDRHFYIDTLLLPGESGGPVFGWPEAKVIGMGFETWSAEMSERELGISRPLSRVLRMDQILPYRERLLKQAAEAGKPFLDW